jgi:hypothetical protein
MGFGVEQAGEEMEGVHFVADYDGPGEHRVLFLKTFSR